jgi:lambda repressor-like predicted transcriptional regulator
VNTPEDDRLRPLPIRPRPRTGESIASYIRRLARAHHLRPSYLHGYLSEPPHYTGARPQPHRLAALSGRSVSTLERALADLAPKPRPQPPTQRRRPVPKTRTDAKSDLFAAIRHDANEEHLSVRALAERYQVHRRTVRQALTDPTPPPRKPIIRPAAVLDRIRHHIDTMLTSDHDLNARQIWERLVDDHDADASYTTVATYIARKRPPPTRRRPNPGGLH